MTPLAPDLHESFFCCEPGGSHGVYITRPYYELLRQFSDARLSASIWQEFVAGFTPNAWEYISLFVKNDSLCPRPDDPMDMLREELFIFHDRDFPFLQCHQECWQHCRAMLPEVAGVETSMTEYGEVVAYFPAESYETVAAQLRRGGHRVAIAPRF